MSSGILKAKAQLHMELDNILSHVSRLERLIRQEVRDNSKMDWFQTSATLMDMNVRIEGWKDQLA